MMKKFLKFNTPMAKAKRERIKSHTRRPVKIPENFFTMEAEGFESDSDNKWFAWGIESVMGSDGSPEPSQCYASSSAIPCPYGNIGDIVPSFEVLEDGTLAYDGDVEIKKLRIEKLQDISDGDCIKEGLKLLQGGIKTEFYVLWDSIYKETKYNVSKNPYVWVIEFKVKEES